MASYIEKIKGEKVRSGLPYPDVVTILISGLGGFLIMGLLYLLHADLKVVLCFIVPFGASATLLFAAPAAPFSQPRNVLFGHLLSALVGVAVYSIFKQNVFWALALACSIAIMLMMATKTVHPPAGATALIPVVTGISSFVWPFYPVLLGAVILVVFAVIYNNLWAKRRYPAFWW